jgi:hypothetical protein
MDLFSGEDQARLQTVFEDADFCEAENRREQILAACNILRPTDAQSRFSYARVGTFFGLSGGVIEGQYKLGRSPRMEPGRPKIFSNEIEQWITDLVHERFHQQKPITFAELLDTLQYQHSVVVSLDYLRHVIRRLDTVKTVVGIPMESDRVAVDPAVLTEWYRSLAEKIQEVPRRFILNADETGCADFTDSREVKVIVPYDFERNSVPLPVDRHVKRATLTACIAADGFRMRPFVIVDRKTMEKDLIYYGYDDSTVSIVSQENAFMTQKLFEIWAETIFFPSVQERRQQFGYQGKAILLIDGLGSHHTAKFLSDCADRNIEPVFLVAHSSDQTQPLDLLTFALLKQRFSSSKFGRLTSGQSNKIVRILGAWFAASVPHYNVEAFMSIGLVPEERNGELYLAVHMEQARQLRGWPDFGPVPRAALPSDAHNRIRLRIC